MNHTVVNIPLAEQLAAMSNYAPQPRLPGVPLLNDAVFPELRTNLPFYRGGEAEGVFVFRGAEGRIEVPLRSGSPGPGDVFEARGITLGGAAEQSATHLEGHAAGIMYSLRGRGVTEAELYINYANRRLMGSELPGPCAFCRSSVASELLPPRSELIVHYVVDQAATRGNGVFVGRANQRFQHMHPPLSGG